MRRILVHRDRLQAARIGARKATHRSQPLPGRVRLSFWGVVNTQPTAEKRALWHLEWQGFTTYAPKEKIVRVVRGKKVASARWLFPRYIFVWINDTWHAML